MDIVNPDEKDLDYLKNNFKFHPLDFEDVVTPSVRTKIDEYDSYHFLVMLFPFTHVGSDDACGDLRTFQAERNPPAGMHGSTNKIKSFDVF